MSLESAAVKQPCESTVCMNIAADRNLKTPVTRKSRRCHMASRIDRWSHVGGISLPVLGSLQPLP